MTAPPRRVAVVTGASAGVGRAAALALADRGFDLGLIARDREGLVSVCRDAEAWGVRALALPCDIAHPEEVDKVADEAAQRLGGIDVWVNCAMVTIFARVRDIKPEEFKRVTDVTYLGQVYGTQAALRHMRPRDRGVIVQVGSALAYRSIPLQSAYCAAKHAVLGFTESLRTELMHEGSGIELTTVHLPAVNTPQFRWSRNKMGAEPRPAGQPVAPEVAGRAIADAAINPRREIYLGWSTVKAILGNMVLPHYGDRKAEETWEGQMTEAPVDARPGNLFDPVTDVPRDRGPFTDDAEASAVAVSALSARLGVAAGLGVGLLLLTKAAFAAGRRSSRHRGRSG